MAVSDSGELTADPEVTLTGIPHVDGQGRSMEDLACEAALEAFQSMPRPLRRDPDAVAEAVRRATRAALSAVWNKKPTCHVHVLEV
jgi:ribonuclease J